MEFKKIPYYGEENSIHHIKELGENLYEISVFKNEEKLDTYKVNLPKEKILKDYRTSLNKYITNFNDKYIETKNIVKNDTVNKRCFKMLIAAILALITLPTVGILLDNTLIFTIAILLSCLTIPTIQYTSYELRTNSSTDDMKKSIKDYENLIKLKEILEKEIIKLNKTTMTNVSNMKQEQLENKHIKEKKM